MAQNEGVEINLNAVLFKICVGSPRVIEIAMWWHFTPSQEKSDGGDVVSVFYVHVL